MTKLICSETHVHRKPRCTQSRWLHVHSSPLCCAAVPVPFSDIIRNDGVCWRLTAGPWSDQSWALVPIKSRPLFQSKAVIEVALRDFQASAAKAPALTKEQAQRLRQERDPNFKPGAPPVPPPGLPSSPPKLRASLHIARRNTAHVYDILTHMYSV